PVRADGDPHHLSAGARAGHPARHPVAVAAIDDGWLHRRLRLAILVPGLCADGGGQRPHPGAGRGAVRTGRVLLLVQAASVAARGLRHRADRRRRGAADRGVVSPQLLMAISTAPQAISPMPIQPCRLGRSPRKTTPNRATSTTLSLSIGATNVA